MSTPHRVRMPSGEDLDDVRQRVMVPVNGVVEEHEGTIVLVSHRVVLKVLVCALLGLDNSHFWRIQQDTASTNLFKYQNGQWIIGFLNDTSYLKSLGKTALADF